MELLSHRSCVPFFRSSKDQSVHLCATSKDDFLFWSKTSKVAMGLILSSRVINFFVRIVKETLLRCQTLKLFKNSGVGIWKLKVPGEFKHFVCKVRSKAFLTKVFYIDNNPA